jgi:hypothetical protein
MNVQDHPYLKDIRRVSYYWDIVSWTARYRYSVRWDGARRLMAAKGYDFLATIQLGCDPGNDLSTIFALPDDTMVQCDFQTDRVTRQAVSIASWDLLETLSPDAIDTNDTHATLAREILKDAQLSDAFNRAVLAFFDFHLRQNDKPLRPRQGLERNQ